MVHYYFKVIIPSLNRKVSFHEITIRDLININKSLINGNYDEMIECFDLIIEECCHEKGLLFTLLDKVIILLSIRAYSVSTFCNLTIKDNEEGKEFEHTLEVNELINKLLSLPVTHQKEFKNGDVVIEYGIPTQPIQDVNRIETYHYIHRVKHNDVILLDYKSDKGELQKIVQELEYKFFEEVKSYATGLYEVFQQNPLYVIRSPYPPARDLVTQRMSLDYGMYDLLKLLFTENLHNLYRAIYNFNQTLNVSPLYTENLVPVEKDLLWGYHLKEQRDAEASKALNTKSGLFQP